MAAIEDLISYMYNELPENEKKSVEEELASSWPLREKLAVLRESQWRLQKMRLLSPRRQTIDQIMKYARKSTVAPSNLKA